MRRVGASGKTEMGSPLKRVSVPTLMTVGGRRFLPFDSTHRDAFDEGALSDEEEDENRHDGDGAGRHQVGPGELSLELPQEALQTERNGELLRLVQVNERAGVVV